MEKHCAATCGFCTLSPSLSPKVPTSVATSLPSNDPSQWQEGRERGDKRRKDAMNSISSNLGETLLTDATQIELQYVRIVAFFCLTLVLLVVIWKCRILYFKGASKNQGELVMLLDDEIVQEPRERSCFKPKEMDANKQEGEANN